MDARYKKTIILISSLMILSPFLTALFFIKGCAPEWLDTDNDWIGFFGSLIGSIVTLIGLSLTIKLAKEQADEERRYQRSPYMHLRNKATEKIDEMARRLTFKFDSDYNTDIHLMFSIKNLGLGPALNVTITNIRYDSMKIANVVYDLYELDIGQECDCIATIKKDIDIEVVKDDCNAKMIRRDVEFSLTLLFTDINCVRYKQDIDMILGNIFAKEKGDEKYTYMRSNLYVYKASKLEVIRGDQKKLCQKTIKRAAHK